MCPVLILCAAADCACCLQSLLLAAGQYRRKANASIWPVREETPRCFLFSVSSAVAETELQWRARRPQESLPVLIAAGAACMITQETKRNILVEKVAGDLDAIFVSRIQPVQHACQLGYHATQPVVLLVLFSVLHMVSTENLSNHIVIEAPCTAHKHRWRTSAVAPAVHDGRAHASTVENRPSSAASFHGI